MASLLEADVTCPVCGDIFNEPVVLSCSHSFCRDCIQRFWWANNCRECPMCRRSCVGEPILSLVLQNLCETYAAMREEHNLEDSCSVHWQKLDLFCVADKKLVCIECTTDVEHISHTFMAMREVAPLCKEELKAALTSLQEKLKHNENIKGVFEKTVQHIKVQADHTELQLKRQFKKLHQFLQDEEETLITALREEEEQKKQLMKEKLEEMNTHISALSHTIRDMEEMLKDNDVCFLKKFPGAMERVQISKPDPQTPHGALIHMPRYLGNLSFRVWEKMRDIVSYTPVILDPNTAHPELVLSDDLTSVDNNGDKQPLPVYPERFDCYPCVLGSEGFTSGSHCWDVEVKENRCWCLGVTTASNPRKGVGFFNTGVWRVTYGVSNDCLNNFPVFQSLDRVRVDLDCDKGIVSFSDPVTRTHIHTYTTTFTDTVFPFFGSGHLFSLRILPIK